METTDHLFESIHCVYSNKSRQNTNISATTVGNTNTVKYLFGLPTSNTEYCQIPPNTKWELALRDINNDGDNKSGNLSGFSDLVDLWVIKIK